MSTPPANPPPLTAGKRWLFAAVSCGLVLALLELGLWAAGVPTLIDREDPFQGFSNLVSVFQRQGSVYRTRPTPLATFNDQSFLADKPANGLRIFCLGGSSAYGFPWGADVAFTAILGEAVAAQHPQWHVEAVNAAGVSYGMYRLNIVADELVRYQPDIFLVYSGHNEFVEPAYFNQLKERSPIRTRLEYGLAHSRTYSGLHAIMRRLRRRPATTAPAFGVAVDRDVSRLFTPAEKRVMVAEFRRHLTRLVRRATATGVKVVLATVPANLREWRPEASTGLAALDPAARRAWETAFRSGERHLAAGDFAAAGADLEMAARIAPGHAETWFRLGQASEGRHRWAEARTAYERACDEDASPVRRLSAFNTVIREVAQETGVLLVDVERIFEEHSDHGLVGFNLIEDYVHPTREGHELIAWHLWETLEQAGWWPGATTASRAIFDRLVEERRRRPVTANAMWFYNQGVLLAHQGRWEEAIDRYQEALTRSPDYAGAHYNLGEALARLGRVPEAIAHYEQVLQSKPDHVQALNNLGVALIQTGRPAEAVARFEQALRLRPDYAEAHNNLALALVQLNRVAEAIPRFEQALRLNPELPQAHNSLGVARLQVGEPVEAIRQFQEELRLNPDSAEAHYNLGGTLLQQNRAAEALAHLECAARLAPANPAIRFQLARALERLGRLTEAAAQRDQAQRLNSIQAPMPSSTGGPSH